MASEGLLAFIGGSLKAVSDEYDEMRAETRDIRKEERAEERAIRAEQRRQEAEKAAARWRANFERSQLEPDARAKAEVTKGLLEDEMHPDLLLDEAKSEAELRRINEGKDPTSARAEYQDMSKAGRIRAGLDAETAAVESGLEAKKTKATRSGTLEAEREDDKMRAEQGLPPRNSSSSRIDFSISEATTQLKEDLSAIHGLDFEATREGMKPRNGGSRLVRLATGEDSIEEIMEDPQELQQLRGELAIKIHNATNKRLKEAANRKEITSMDQVTPLGNLIAERVDQTVNAMKMVHERVANGANPDQELDMVYNNLLKAYGEPEDTSKQSAGFKSIWSVFKRSLKNGS